jgi:hypothetical protein
MNNQFDYKLVKIFFENKDLELKKAQDPNTTAQELKKMIRGKHHSHEIKCALCKHKNSSDYVLNKIASQDYGFHYLIIKHKNVKPRTLKLIVDYNFNLTKNEIDEIIQIPNLPLSILNTIWRKFHYLYLNHPKFPPYLRYQLKVPLNF